MNLRLDIQPDRYEHPVRDINLYVDDTFIMTYIALYPQMTPVKSVTKGFGKFKKTSFVEMDFEDMYQIWIEKIVSNIEMMDADGLQETLSKVKVMDKFMGLNSYELVGRLLTKLEERIQFEIIN